eukprot:sb/3462394/
MCDDFQDSSDDYIYCDEKWKTWVNCTTKHQETSYQAMVCPINGYNSTIDKLLECDESSHCDNSFDEICYKNGTNIVNIYREMILEGQDVSEFENTTMRCPWSGNLSYYISSDKLCDGYPDCPLYNGDSEESACSETGLNSSIALGYVTRRNHVFVAPCLPGLDLKYKCSSSTNKVGEIQITMHSIDQDVNRCGNIDGLAYAVAATRGDCDQKGRQSDQYAVDMATTQYSFSTLDQTTLYMTQQYGWLMGANLYNNQTGAIDYIFNCDNGAQIMWSKVCDYSNDCGDNSDEINCRNRLQCAGSTTSIKKTKICDKIFDCAEKNDECSSFCKRSGVEWRMIKSGFYRFVAIVIATCALSVNAVSLWLFAKSLVGNSDKSFSLVVNDILVALIALGDFSVGIYIILIFSYDQWYGDDYCTKRLEWLSSATCGFIGTISTFGNQLSLLCMTVLSIFRLVSIKTMMVFSSMSKKKVVILVLCVSSLLLYSLAIGVLPILKVTENYFVNGLYYPGNPIITDSMSKDELRKSFKAYVEVPPFNKLISWDDWRILIKWIFDSKMPLGIPTTEDLKNFELKNDTTLSIGFYGNSGVCLFKYFVKREDQQLGYSMYVLVSNLVCFIVITVSYLLIILHTNQTSKNAGTKGTAQSRESMKKLQRKISLIIATDFATWVPFIILAFLNVADIVDGSEFYEFCSILLIPLNSVVNPLIYNSDKIAKGIKRIRGQVQSLVSSIGKTKRIVIILVARILYD